jgi:hypothetical protein
MSFVGICTNDPNVLSWQASNANSSDLTFVWWVVGGSASGGPVSVPANGTASFTTPVDGPLPNTVAIMWIDPIDGSARSLSNNNIGEDCDPDAPATPTPTPSPTPGVLIPVTGIDLPAIFRDSMFLNLGIGIFGFALILLGVGIRLDRGNAMGDDDDEYEEYYDDDEE